MTLTSDQARLRQEFATLVKQIGDDLSTHVLEPRLSDLTKSWNHAVGAELGRIESLLDRMAREMAANVRQAQKLVADAAGELTKLVEHFESHLQQSLEASNVSEALSQLHKEAERAQQASLHLQRASEAVESGVASLEEQLVRIHTSIDEKMPSLKDELHQLNRLLTAFNQLVSGIEQTTSTLDRVSGSFADLHGRLGKTSEALFQLDRALNVKLSELSQHLQKELQERLENTTKELADFLSPRLQQLSTTHRELHSSLHHRFDDMENLTRNLSRQLETGVEAVVAAQRSQAESTQEALSGLQKALDQGLAKQDKVFDRRLDAIRSAFQARDSLLDELRDSVAINRRILIGVGVVVLLASVLF